MPLYEYRCNECSRRYTLLVGMTAKKPRRQCPRCGSRRATKLISRIASIVRSDGSDDDFGDLDDDFDDEYDDFED